METNITIIFSLSTIHHSYLTKAFSLSNRVFANTLIFEYISFYLQILFLYNIFVEIITLTLHEKKSG